MAAPADDTKHWLEPPEWWKKTKPLRWLPIVIGLAIVLPGLWVAKGKLLPSVHPEKERFVEVAADPVVFLDQMKSYETLDSVRARLDGAKVVYNVTSSRPTPSGKYPPRDRDTISAKYPHLGLLGQLTLEFFNDRLYEATFVPPLDDLDEYVEKLHAADKRLKRDRNGRAEQVAGNLRVASNVDFANTEVGQSLRTKPYVIWQDLRLMQQLDEWDKRFIALPSRP
jgi:hypothetical protein